MVPTDDASSADILRVLIAEDYADISDTFAFVLEAEGHLVEVSRDGLDTIRLAESFRPDVILLDIGMPHLDGYEAARLIRQQMGGAVVLIAVTAWTREEDKRRALDAGFDCHFAKPPDFQALTGMLAELKLQKQRRRPKAREQFSDG